MSNQSHICPKCESVMDIGFVTDHLAGTIVQGEWIKGEPELNFLNEARIKGKERHKIVAYRCPNCSYVEFFAP